MGASVPTTDQNVTTAKQQRGRQSQPCALPALKAACHANCPHEDVRDERRAIDARPKQWAGRSAGGGRLPDLWRRRRWHELNGHPLGTTGEAGPPATARRTAAPADARPCVPATRRQSSARSPPGPRRIPSARTPHGLADHAVLARGESAQPRRARRPHFDRTLSGSTEHAQLDRRLWLRMVTGSTSNDGPAASSRSPRMRSSARAATAVFRRVASIARIATTSAQDRDEQSTSRDPRGGDLSGGSSGQLPRCQTDNAAVAGPAVIGGALRVDPSASKPQPSRATVGGDGSTSRVRRPRGRRSG